MRKYNFGEYEHEYWGIMVRDMPVPVYPKAHSLEDHWEWYPKALYAQNKYGKQLMHERICRFCERRTCNEDLSSRGRYRMGEIARRLGCEYDTSDFGMNKSQLSEYIIMKVCRSLAQLEICHRDSEEEWNTWLALMDLLKDPNNHVSRYRKKYPRNEE